MPDLEDFDSAIPVVVKDANGTVLAHEVDLASCSADELAVVGQVANVQGGKVHVFFQNGHAVMTSVCYFTLDS